MARATSHPTRERLLDVAEALFARSTIAGTTTREITEVAQQRNASAVTYHFQSREGLLRAVLARRGGPVDEQRGLLRAHLGSSPKLVELVRCLVIPYSEMLHSDFGRSYVRIVAQLRGSFAAWRVQSDVATAKNLSAILGEIESFGPAEDSLRRERVINMIMLITAATADRARCIDEGITPELAHDAFVENLILVCAAVQGAARHALTNAR